MGLGKSGQSWHHKSALKSLRLLGPFCRGPLELSPPRPTTTQGPQNLEVSTSKLLEALGLRASPRLGCRLSASERNPEAETWQTGGAESGGGAPQVGS